jgi:membrane dipeptidase
VDERGGDRRSHPAVMAVIAERAATDPAPVCTASDVADHLDHIRDVAGVDHVGIGGDYDGAPWFPVDMPDVSGYPRLFEVLRGRGWSEPDLAALGHGNVLRALHEVESAAGLS